MTNSIANKALLFEVIADKDGYDPRIKEASDVRGVRGLKDNRSSEIFATITRWIDAGAVKRRARGTYERVKA